MSDTFDEIRNVAIIAHVDHGKTTLVDALLRQTGVFRSNEVVDDRVMDSNDLERERGITILAKNASVRWKNYKINIIDTPGHADFGGEVERILKMADGAILLVDAAEGPLPQTRFVLSKSLSLGMPVILVINKIDRQDARPDEVLTETFDLFCDLEASDEQTEFSTLYAIGKEGICSTDLAVRGTSLEPLLETIVNVVPAPKADPEGPFRFLVHNTHHDEYVGKLAIGRIHRGRATVGQQAALLGADAETIEKIGGVYVFEGLKRVKVDSASAGDLIAIAGVEKAQIGDTLTDPANRDVLPRIQIDEPTIKMRFSINDSPLAGKAGKWITSRHLRDRLFREGTRNIALRVEETESPDAFIVFGRGELMLAILAETMRREGYELSLGMPEVVTQMVDGVLCEPTERVVIDIPEEYVGAVTSQLGERRGRMEKMANMGHGRSRLEFIIPSRGLIGFRSLFLTETRGTGLLNSLFEGWFPQGEPMLRRRSGSIVSDRAGKTTPYALFGLQPRGSLFIGPSVEVYEGMVIGECARNNDMDVNPTKEKKLTNIRAAGKDDNVILAPPRTMTIEGAMDYIDRDEMIEITPDAVRVRKRVLSCNRRPRRDG